MIPPVTAPAAPVQCATAAGFFSLMAAAGLWGWGYVPCVAHRHVGTDASQDEQASRPAVFWVRYGFHGAPTGRPTPTARMDDGRLARVSWVFLWILLVSLGLPVDFACVRGLMTFGEVQDGLVGAAARPVAPGRAGQSQTRFFQSLPRLVTSSIHFFPLRATHMGMCEWAWSASILFPDWRSGLYSYFSST